MPGPTVKLVCTAGPLAGQEFVLSGQEVVIGRASDNAIPVPDTSVSRKHVLLRSSGAGWAASDMGSGNGTLINGQPIAEETALHNGDVITIGDTEMSVVEDARSTDRLGAAVPRPSRGGGLPSRPRPMSRAARARLSQQPDPEAQKKRRRLLLILTAVVAGVVLVAVGFKAYRSRADFAKRQAEDQQKQTLDHHRLLFQEGKNLVREGRWSEAKAKFDELAAANPNFPQLTSYLEFAAKEIPNEANLRKAMAALESDEIGPAAMALRAVSADTQQHEPLRKARSQLDDRFNKKLVAARALVGSSSDVAAMKKLKALTDDLLVADSQNRDVKELNQQAAEAIERLERPVAPVRGPTPQPWKDVAARFKDGDLSGAFSLANECASRKVPQCRVLVAQIAEFQEKNKRVESLNAKELSELVDLDEKICGGSKLAQPGRTRLVSTYYKSASSAKQTGEWARAYDYAQRTLRLDPQNAGAQAILMEVRGKAKEVYLLGYQAKDTSPDDALKYFKECVAMTPNNDESHQKCQSWIQKLER